MESRSCPRCGGWVMRQPVSVGLIETSCVMCGWVSYRDAPAHDQVRYLLGSRQTAKNESAKGSHPLVRRRGLATHDASLARSASTLRR